MVDAVSFSPEERARFQHAEEILKPLGKDVYSAALEYVAAASKLPLVQKFYLELVTKPQGIAWFSLVPISESV